MSAYKMLQLEKEKEKNDDDDGGGNGDDDARTERNKRKSHLRQSIVKCVTTNFSYCGHIKGDIDLIDFQTRAVCFEQRQSFLCVCSIETMMIDLNGIIRTTTHLAADSCNNHYIMASE